MIGVSLRKLNALGIVGGYDAIYQHDLDGLLQAALRTHSRMPLTSNAAERLLTKAVCDRNGHRSDRPLFGFIAGKWSVVFRFLEAASHHRVVRALTRTMSGRVVSPHIHNCGHPFRS